MRGGFCLFWAKWSLQGQGHITLAHLLHHLWVGVKRDHGSRTPECGRLQDDPEEMKLDVTVTHFSCRHGLLQQTHWPLYVLSPYRTSATGPSRHSQPMLNIFQAQFPYPPSRLLYNWPFLHIQEVSLPESPFLAPSPPNQPHHLCCFHRSHRFTEASCLLWSPYP